MFDFAQMILELLPQRGGMDERAIFRRRTQSGNLEAIQRLGRVGEWDVHRAHGEPGGVEQPPDRGRAARGRVGITHRVATRFGFDEMKDAVLAGILAGHE